MSAVASTLHNMALAYAGLGQEDKAAECSKMSEAILDGLALEPTREQAGRDTEGP